MNMRSTLLTAAAGAAMAFTSIANAGISFSFADPVPGRQMSNVANGAGAGIGALSYDTNANIVFYVDASDLGAGTLTFNTARMEMALTLGAAVTSGGVTLAPVTGSFTIYDMTGNVRTNILTGSADSGTFVRITNTNSILFSDPDFTYTAGPALSSVLPQGTQFVPSTEAVFTLTDVQTVGGSGLTTSGGAFRSFAANASFTGNTETTIVPAPGAFALAGASGLLVARRRRA
jgi:hypothetical protein